MLSQDLTVRPAEVSDAELILDIIWEATHWLKSRGIDQWQVPWSLAWVEWRISLGDFRCAFLNNEMVGIARLVWSDEEVWDPDHVMAGYVHSLAVRRKFSSRGIGRDILRQLEEECLRQNKNVLRLDCVAHNDHLCQYYGDQGYREVGEKVVGDYHGRLFEKQLA